MIDMDTKPNPATDDDDQDPFTSYHAVLNDEEQFSIWPEELELPSGWQAVFTAPRETALDFVEVVWKDMRPLALRAAMDGNQVQSAWEAVRAELARRGLPCPEPQVGGPARIASLAATTQAAV
jgi:MbtH protein